MQDVHAARRGPAGPDREGLAGRARAFTAAVAVLAVGFGCASGCGEPPRRDEPGSAPPTQSPPSSSRGVQPDSVPLAELDAALYCHAISPEESLAVLLLGTVGPDGSWSLDELRIEPSDTGVVVTPVVRHTRVDLAMQMIVPLDQVLRLHLEPGMQTVEIRGRNRTQVDSVLVALDAGRPPPETRLELEAGLAPGRVLVHFEGEPGDGFVDALEFREVGQQGTAEWLPFAGAERQGAVLLGSLQLELPPPGESRQVEARAIDGQGVADPTPAVVALPTR
jgi:hypothetical protein